MKKVMCLEKMLLTIAQWILKLVVVIVDYEFKI